MKESSPELPHMLVEIDDWKEIVSKMGFKNNDEIIIYDNSDVASACRCWFNFIYFGHDPKLVHVLNGGLKKWIIENRKVKTQLPTIEISNYNCLEKNELVKNKNLVDQNIEIQKFKIIDARRDPMGCCFSGFKQLFAEGQEFSYSLEDIGNYYVDYIKLMDHWDKVLPGFVLRVNHEDVVDNFLISTLIICVVLVNKDVIAMDNDV